MIDPRKLRTIILMVVAVGLILIGVFSLIGPDDGTGLWPVVPVAPLPPVPPEDVAEPLPLPVLAIIQGLRVEEIGMPYRVAVWGDAIYVVDALAVNGVIKVLDRAGNYLRHFGSIGQQGLAFVVDIDVNAQGNVVLLDTAPSIHVFSPQGEHLQKIDIDIGFAWSKALRATSDEYYVLSLSGLLRMTQAGQMVSVWPAEGASYAFGTGASEYYLGPSGLAAAPDGLWVADSVNARLLLISYDGELLKEITIPAGGDGKAAYPSSLAVDTDGSIHVVDAAGLRIMRFSAQGNLQWQEKLEARTDGSHPEEIYDITMLQFGKMLIADSWSRRLEVWDMTARGVWSRQALAQPQPSFMFPIHVVAADQSIFILSEDVGLGGDAEYAIYRQAAPGAAVSLFSASFDGAPLRNVARLAAHGDRLYALGVDSVLVYGTDGKEIGSLGDESADWGGFAVSTLMGEPMGPQGLAISDFGEVYVADTFASRLVVFHADGTFLRQLPLPGNVYPVALAFSRDGTHLFILNSFEGRVIKTDAAGNIVHTFAAPGQGDGQLGVVADLGLFDGPRDIGIDNAGNVWVLDTYNARLAKFTANGDWLGARGHFGGKAGEFYLPAGLFVDVRNAVMYIADTHNHRIQVVALP